MSAAAYKSQVENLELPELIGQAEIVRDATETPGWRLVQASVDAHRDRMLRRLLNETTKPEDIPYLRGVVAGLESMREAADAIVTLAEERERAAIKEHA